MSRYVIIVLAAVVSSAVLFGTAHFLVRHSTRQFSSQPETLRTASWFNRSVVPIGIGGWLVVVGLVGLVAVEFELRGLLVPIALATILTAGIAWWVAHAAEAVNAEELMFGSLIAALLTWPPIAVWWYGVSYAL